MHHFGHFGDLLLRLFPVPPVIHVAVKRLTLVKVKLISLYPKSPPIAKDKTENFGGAQLGDAVWEVRRYLSGSSEIIHRDCHR